MLQCCREEGDGVLGSERRLQQADIDFNADLVMVRTPQKLHTWGQV